MKELRIEFVRFAIEHRALCFGEFKTKAGRVSPYFFNAGLFNDGAALHRLSQFYAKAILNAGLNFDLLFGPAYKGIPLAAATSIALAEMGHNVRFCFDRKEAKDHGEGGDLIGAPLKGNVLIIDDVISAGTSVRTSLELIRKYGATPCGVVVALDRMERGQTDLSAVQEVEQVLGLPVISIASLDDVLGYLQSNIDLSYNLSQVRQYRDRYGVTVK